MKVQKSFPCGETILKGRFLILSYLKKKRELTAKSLLVKKQLEELGYYAKKGEKKW